MKIAQVGYLYEPALGGVEMNIKGISEGLAKRGHRVDVYVSDFLSLNRSKRIKIKQETINGVHVFRKIGIGFYKSIYTQNILMPGIVELFFRNYDAIHIHSIPSFHLDVALIVAKIKKIPILVSPYYGYSDVQTIYESNKIEYRILRVYFKTWVRFALSLVDKILVNTESEKEAFKKYLHVKEGSVDVVPVGIDTKEFSKVNSDDLQDFASKNNLAGKKIILTVGRVTKTKGADVLIKAASPMLKNNGNLRVVVAGSLQDVKWLEYLKRLAEQEGVLSSVLFMSNLSRKDLICAYKSSKIFVLPSRGGESFGIVLIEAMYSGCVTICSDTGALPTVVSNNKTGLIFHNESFLELRDCLAAALKNDDKFIGMVRDAKMEVIEKYSWDTILTKLENIYGRKY